MTTASPEQPRALIFGHSHVWALKGAAPKVAPELGYLPKVLLCGTNQFPGSPYVLGLNGRPTLSPVLIAAFNLAQKTPQDWLVCFAQGNHYNQLGMLTSGPGFDFVLPSAPEMALDEGLTLLPYGLVREMMLAQMAEMREFLRLLAGQAPKGQIVVLGPPPPPRGETEIAELAAKGAAAGDPETRISAPAVRLKLWHLQNAEMAALCARHGLQYLPGGYPEASDPEGFLRPELVKDAVHATADYGMMTLRRLGALIAGPGAAAVASGEAA